ncbi:MAG: hypothetical protein M0O99_01840 [Desulfuromonas thiophila]|nr:hypothetical protein [Desulfuromonas thiophila]
MSQPLPVEIKTPPRETWQDCVFPDPDLPIQGGWGYTREDACIIDKNDAIVDSNEEFDGIGVEYDFIKKRNETEITRSGYWLREHDWRLICQRMLKIDGRCYDHLVCEITIHGVPDSQEKPYNGWFKIETNRNPVCYRRDFWFDITSFYLDR